MVESTPELSAAYKQGTADLFAHYYPIETSATLSIEEKLPLMQEWYTKAHSLLLRESLTEALLVKAARASAVALRPGFTELFALCRQRGAPFVVCSAGLGNVVQALLRNLLPASESAALDELPIVSNWLRFGGAPSSSPGRGGGGTVSGFSAPLLHMYNKNGAFIRDQLGEERWARLSTGRTVVLVLGDSLGDAVMADGLMERGAAAVVKVGFLNETDPARVAARLPAYEAAFDAVVLGDGSFEWVVELAAGMR